MGKALFGCAGPILLFYTTDHFKMEKRPFFTAEMVAQRNGNIATKRGLSLLWLAPGPSQPLRERCFLQPLRQELNRPFCTHRESTLWFGSVLPESCEGILSACKSDAPYLSSHSNQGDGHLNLQEFAKLQIQGGGLLEC